MKVIYQVKDWDIYFENDRSRQREKCSFVCVPNKQHGMGFIRIVGEPDGAAIYGIWCLILGACSQQKKRYGWLTDNGLKDGNPWTVEDLADKFRRPKEEVQRALDFICSVKVGWMVKHEIANDGKALAKSNPALTADSPPSDPERNERTETNERKGKKEEKGNEAKLGAREPLTLTAAGEETIRLISLCKTIFGEEEVRQHHKRWLDRATVSPSKLNKVLAEVRVMKLENKIKTTAARTAEDLWKRFK